MKTYSFYVKREEKFVSHIKCDICGREADIEKDWMEFGEFVSIDTIGGYGSVFGDGNSVEIDICQHCLKEQLGKFIRINGEKSL